MNAFSILKYSMELQEAVLGEDLPKNGHNPNNMATRNDDSSLNTEVKMVEKLKRLVIALAILLTVSFAILIITFSVLFANLKYDIGHHDHPPKVGAQMNTILEKEELCLLCDEVRLGPSVEEGRMLDTFVRKHEPEAKGEKCCVETPSQLLKLLQMVSSGTHWSQRQCRTFLVAYNNTYMSVK